MFSSFLRMEPYDCRALIKHLMKNQLNTKEIHNALVNTQYECCNILRCEEMVLRLGKESCDDAHSPGRPSIVTNDENGKMIQDMIMSDKRLTTRKTAQDAGVSYSTIQ